MGSRGARRLVPKRDRTADVRPWFGAGGAGKLQDLLAARDEFELDARRPLINRLLLVGVLKPYLEARVQSHRESGPLENGFGSLAVFGSAELCVEMPQNQRGF